MTKGDSLQDIEVEHTVFAPTYEGEIKSVNEGEFPKAGFTVSEYGEAKKDLQKTV
jgi:hypothetical protein